MFWGLEPTVIVCAEPISPWPATLVLTPSPHRPPEPAIKFQGQTLLPGKAPGLAGARGRAAMLNSAAGGERVPPAFPAVNRDARPHAEGLVR